MVKPLSPEEVLDIAELRLALISLAVKPAHPHLAPADFDHAYELAKRMTRTNSAKGLFECNRSFWDTIFGKAQRPILREVFRQLDGIGHPGRLVSWWVCIQWQSCFPRPRSLEAEQPMRTCTRTRLGVGRWVNNRHTKNI
jgi:DNA-binding GntR family transcriptional regulator